MDQQLAAPFTRRSGKSGGSLLLTIAAIVAVAGVTFAIGRVTAPGSAGGSETTAATEGAAGSGVGPGSVPSGAPGAARNGAAAGGVAGFAGNMTIAGTVAGLSSTALTLQLPSGSTVEIPIDSSTTYHEQASGTKDAVIVGSSVTVTVSGGGASGASAAPNASGAPSLGAASDVTVGGN